jgi:hypothetical protein
MPPRRPRPADSGFEPRSAKRIPFAFVLDELSSMRPRTNPMFGCHAVYVGEKIVLILRDRPNVPHDNGVWIATVREQHEALRPELPSMRDITVLGEQSSGWQIIPKTAPSFEDEVLRACALIRERDPRIGKVPKARRPRASIVSAKTSPAIRATRAARAKAKKPPARKKARKRGAT